MDPTTTFCPNLACPARAKLVRAILVSIRERQTLSLYAVLQNIQRYQGHRLLSAAHRGRPCHPDHHVACPWLSGQAIVVAFGFDERTVAAWGHVPAAKAKLSRNIWSSNRGTRSRAGRRDTRQAPRRGLDGAGDDGLHPVVAGWRGGEQRAMPLIRRLIERVRRCALPRPLLFCTAGLCSYIRAIREDFAIRSAPEPWPASTAPLAQRLHCPGRQALRPATRRRRRAPHRGGHTRTRRDAAAPLARHGCDQHRLH